MFYGVMGLYLVYALVVALRGRNYTGMLGLLALFGDTVFFLIMASYGGRPHAVAGQRVLSVPAG